MLEHFFDELNNAKKNEKLAFISIQDSISYKKLIKKINLASQYMLQNNFTNGLTAIIMPHTIETCILILACLKAKATFVSIDVSAPPNEIKQILLQLQPHKIISHDANLIMKELKETIYHPDIFFYPENNSDHYQTLYIDNDEAFVTLTSGSTGVVKGVVHTNYSLCEAITHVLTSLDLKEPHRLLCSISHPSNAFLRNMLACLIKGATFILGFNTDFQNVITLIEKYAPTHVRFSIKDLILFSNQSTDKIKNIKFIQRCDYSGDIVPIEVINNVNKLLITGMLITSYAMSECGTIAINAFTKDQKNQSSTGKIIPGVHYRIVIKKNTYPDSVGELEIKCTTMFKKYLHDDIETKKAFTEDGWFKTGDLFSLQPDGFLVFHGRKKNIIIRNGKNINPDYIRQIIMEWPDIEECAVISTHSAATLQEPIAFCSLKCNGFDSEGFRNHLHNNLNPLWLPSNIYIMKNIPRTLFGKIDLSYIRKNTNLMVQGSSQRIIFECG